MASMGSIGILDVECVARRLRHRTEVEGLFAAIREKRCAFPSTDACFHFLVGVGDDDDPDLQMLWAAVRAFMIFGPWLRPDGVPPSAHSWKVYACWPNVPERLVRVPDEDALGNPLERTKLLATRPIRTSRVYALLRERDAPPFIKISVADAVVFYVCIMSFVMRHAGVSREVPSVKLGGLHWAAH